MRPWRASSSARYWSTKWMSQSPSTLGTMTTSSLSPISPTSRVMSSRNQGEFSALTRTHRPVEPKSVAFAMAMKPSRAAILASIGIASSRLPSTTSTWPASSPAFARTFSLCGGTKWIMRSSRDGSSRNGRGRADRERLEIFARGFHGRPWMWGFRASHRAISQAPQLDARRGALPPSASAAVAPGRRPSSAAGLLPRFVRRGFHALSACRSGPPGRDFSPRTGRNDGSPHRFQPRE